LTVSMSGMSDRREQVLISQQLLLLGAAIGSPSVATSVSADWFADSYIREAIIEIKEVIEGTVPKDEMVKLPGALTKHAGIVTEGDKSTLECIRNEVELRGRAARLRRAAYQIQTANVDTLEAIEQLKQRILEV